jgi:hypothetical protein
MVRMRIMRVLRYICVSVVAVLELDHGGVDGWGDMVIFSWYGEFSERGWLWLFGGVRGGSDAVLS